VAHTTCKITKKLLSPQPHLPYLAIFSAPGTLTTPNNNNYWLYSFNRCYCNCWGLAGGDSLGDFGDSLGKAMIIPCFFLIFAEKFTINSLTSY
jgi:hypothetical protein